ncbi:MAG TPA: CTP synthase [Chthonomonadaceae bacterium]|nr:CTP synthase [Chthonomonadaceae bacterium]
MDTPVRIGLIGDYRAEVIAHQAIPRALALASEALERPLQYEWVPTEEIADVSRVAAFDALWCVPASPYRSMDGALHAIRWAREQGVPFLGTCGGFQHAILEYARNVLGWADAEHAETSPDAARSVITPLTCGLVEVTGGIRFLPNTRIAAAYGCLETTEGYHCRYGLNPAFLAELTSGPLHITAMDTENDVRAVELDGHPFFVATLFQPERAALKGRVPPLVAAFVQAAASNRQS